MTTIHYEYEDILLEPYGISNSAYQAALTTAFLNQWSGATIEIVTPGSNTYATSDIMMIDPADIITIADNVLAMLIP
jgi:hypothetical protein